MQGLPAIGSSPASSRVATTGHVALLLVLSGGFEALFVHHGLNRIDEGLALYPATRLLAGDTLYRDVRVWN